jgi:hypothetical protein
MHIPFAETRNYVQRVMENMLVYRERFGNSPQWKALVPANMSADQSFP